MAAPGGSDAVVDEALAAVTLPQWHGWPLLVILTLAGDGICFLLAAFGELTGRHRMPLIFWWVLWLAQIPLGGQMATGLVLLAGGARPRTPLHFLYGVLILLTLVAFHGLRPGGWLRKAVVQETAYRESRWLMLLSLFLAALVGRGYMTGVVGR